MANSEDRRTRRMEQKRGHFLLQKRVKLYWKSHPKTDKNTDITLRGTVLGVDTVGILIKGVYTTLKRELKNVIEYPLEKKNRLVLIPWDAVERLEVIEPGSDEERLDRMITSGELLKQKLQG